MEMSSSPAWTVFESPIGPLTLAVGPRGLRNIYFPGRRPRLPEPARRPLPEVAGQLEAYFAGELKVFELGLDLRGTPFQREVWRQLLEIPYGATATYGEVARRSMSPSTSRASSHSSGRELSAPRSAATRCRSSSPATG